MLSVTHRLNRGGYDELVTVCIDCVSDRPRPGSTLAIDLNGPDGPLTVLPHQVRSVDLTCRLLSVDGILDFWSVIAIKGRFLDLIALGDE